MTDLCESDVANAGGVEVTMWYGSKRMGSDFERNQKLNTQLHTKQTKR